MTVQMDNRVVEQLTRIADALEESNRLAATRIVHVEPDIKDLANKVSQEMAKQIRLSGDVRSRI